MTGQATAPPAEVLPSEEEPSGVLARLSRLQALQIILVLAVAGDVNPRHPRQGRIAVVMMRLGD